MCAVLLFKLNAVPMAAKVASVGYNIAQMMPDEKMHAFAMRTPTLCQTGTDTDQLRQAGGDDWIWGGAVLILTAALHAGFG